MVKLKIKKMNKDLNFGEVILTIQNPDLKNFLESSSIENWSNLGCSHVHLVYRTKKKEELITFNPMDEFDPRKVSFRFQEMAMELSSAGIDVVTLLANLYFMFPANQILDALKTPLVDSDYFINILLKESLGYMIYYHQFEELIKVRMNKSFEEASSYRKAWNIKSIKTQDELKKHLFDEKRSLYSLLSEKFIDFSIPFVFPKFFGCKS